MCHGFGVEDNNELYSHLASVAIDENIESGGGKERRRKVYYMKKLIGIVWHR